MHRLTPLEQQVVRRATLELNGKAWGIATGLLAGFGLALITIVLVIKGGENVGQHLGLISVVLPGYRVSVLGAVIGFIYFFVIGYGIGRVIGALYNLIAVRKP
jgi:hypothetical protein